MAYLYQQPISVSSILLVPFLTMANLGWLNIAGISPSWGVIWLLPWALVDGPVSGAFAGIALGLILDSIHLGDLTHVPALLLLGWWWGRMGIRLGPIQRSFNLGLLAWIGSMVSGLSLLLQIWIKHGWALESSLREWGFQTLWSQSLLTALLAPMLVSLQLLFLRRRLLR